MTLARLLNAEQIVVHITGEEKAKVLQSRAAIRLNGILLAPYCVSEHTGVRVLRSSCTASNLSRCRPEGELAG